MTKLTISNWDDAIGDRIIEMQDMLIEGVCEPGCTCCHCCQCVRCLALWTVVRDEVQLQCADALDEQDAEAVGLYNGLMERLAELDDLPYAWTDPAAGNGVNDESCWAADLDFVAEVA